MLVRRNVLKSMYTLQISVCVNLVHANRTFLQKINCFTSLQITGNGFLKGYWNYNLLFICNYCIFSLSRVRWNVFLLLFFFPEGQGLLTCWHIEKVSVLTSIVDLQFVCTKHLICGWKSKSHSVCLCFEESFTSSTGQEVNTTENYSENSPNAATETEEHRSEFSCMIFRKNCT